MITDILIFVDRYPCVSLCCHGDVAIGGYGSGHIRLVNYQTGVLLVEVCAHAQWISSLHFATQASLVSIGSCDPS